MVSKITFPGDLMNALNYHEQKVQNGKAEGLHAENYFLEMDQLNFYDKLTRLSDQMALHTTAQTKLLHVSLNFDPSERIDNSELTRIATTYMEKIGFGNQPYLVYKHEDAGHPHIHILTTTIKDDGKRINTHNIGKNQSEKARTEIENEFGLVKATEQAKLDSDKIQPVNVEKVIYGKSETKRSITNVLDAVIKQYKYTSLAELNAILKLYNVTADRGKEGGRIHQTNGLVYRILDQNGNKVGVPIKASSIYSQPKLANLEKRYQENQTRREPFRKHLRGIIEETLTKTDSLQALINELRNQKIDTVLRRNEQGLVYGITFIDHSSKSVFNGSDLAKNLSAAAIQQKFSSQNTQGIPPAEKIAGIPASPTPNHQEKSSSKKETELQNQSHHREKVDDKTRDNSQSNRADMLQQLMESEKTGNYIPFELRKKKKKKKKPKL